MNYLDFTFYFFAQGDGERVLWWNSGALSTKKQCDQYYVGKQENKNLKLKKIVGLE